MFLQLQGRIENPKLWNTVRTKHKTLNKTNKRRGKREKEK